MNARKKAKKYKELLEFERRRFLKPIVVNTERNINHFCAEYLIPNDLIKTDFAIATEYAEKSNAKKLMEMAIKCAKVTVKDEPYLDAKLVRHDLWVVDKGGAE